MDKAYELAIEMAAHGCVSGYLDEWPILYDALWLTQSIHKESVKLTTGAQDAKRMANNVLNYWRGHRHL